MTVAAIDTIETDPLSPFGEPEVPPAEWTYRHCVQNWAAKGAMYVSATLQRISENAGREFRSVVQFPAGQSLERSVAAYVNNGRWLWDCPICKAAQVCSEVDHRAFCVGCFNGGDGWWQVEWPDQRADVETLLSRRPRKETRNWVPAETVDQLQAENLANGLDPDLKTRQWPAARRALAMVRKQRELT